jgi:hypothetical protein
MMMRNNRTDNEYEADKFDMELYNLICRAESNESLDRRWKHLAAQLRGVRPSVRAMMHKRDLEVTG